MNIPALLPRWSSPAPVGHNGGPSLLPRAPGRLSISTPELRDRILELLGDGVPLAAICRTPGMPSRRTVNRWRGDDPAFERICCWAQEEGYVLLAHRVVEEVERSIMTLGPAMARFHLQLAAAAARATGAGLLRGSRAGAVNTPHSNDPHISCARLGSSGAGTSQI